MVKILNNLPSEYDVILDGLENRLTVDASDSNALTIESIRDKLGNRFERIKANEEKPEETGLYSGYYKKQYKGRCSNCGEYGHKSGDCPEKEPTEASHENDHSREFKGKCWYCDKLGHKANKCKQLMADALKRKAEREKASLAIDEVQEASDDESDVASLSELGF